MVCAIPITARQNHYSDNGKTQPSVLLESSLQLSKAAIYGRYEFVQKDAEELDMLNTYTHNPNFNINAITLGTNRILSTVKKTNLTAGIQATLNASPSALKSLYGSAPVGVEVYLRISPSLMKMNWVGSEAWTPWLSHACASIRVYDVRHDSPRHRYVRRPSLPCGKRGLRKKILYNKQIWACANATPLYV